MPTQVIAETTPNPQAMCFRLEKIYATDNASFSSAEEAIRSPLASKLFGFPWTSNVFIGPDFITITKQDWVEWENLSEPLCGLIAEHIDNGEPILLGALKTKDSLAALTQASLGQPEIVQKIMQILEEEIRPQVALDGGDIQFHKFENGKVYVYMQGACSSCPSSTYTLKMGIETRLRAAIPEVEEVIAL